MSRTSTNNRSKLAQRIEIRRAELGQTYAEVPGMLGMSYSHFSTLMSNSSRIKTLSHEKMTAIAKYLNVSLAQVYVWAGVLTAEDFSTPNALEGDLERAFRAMQTDPNDLLCPTSSEWQSLSQEMRVFIVGLYEWASGSNYLAPLRV